MLEEVLSFLFTNIDYNAHVISPRTGNFATSSFETYEHAKPFDIKTNGSVVLTWLEIIIYDLSRFGLSYLLVSLIW